MSTFRRIIKYAQSNRAIFFRARPAYTQHLWKQLSASISTTTSLKYSGKPLQPVVDIDHECMMYENRDSVEEESSHMNLPTGSSHMAPCDIDPWVEEWDSKEPTLDSPNCQTKPDYPPIPENRSRIHEFKGIKVILPKSMVRPETYRYRLEKEDQEKLSDDIRVCKFDK